MRRTTSGAARRLTLAHPGPGDSKGTAKQAAEAAPSPETPLTGIIFLPVMVRPSTAEMPALGTACGPFVRAAEALAARSVSRRTLEASGADVVLLDARESRPTLAYRAIVRLRNAGWARGILLVVAEEDLGMVPVAMSVGASDFVLAAAGAGELEARLRRAGGRLPAEVSRKPQDTASGIQLHWRTHEVSFEGTTIGLTLRELQLLSVLVERGREVVTAEDLARLAWGRQRRPGGGLAAAYVCSLRKKLAWFGGRFGIQTVRGVGYRFIV